jgi:hypothetical protein
MDHTARCRSLDQHGIEGHAIEPPTGLLRMKQELVARKSRVSPCRHSTIGSGVPSREEGIVYAETAKRGFDRRRRHFSDARPAGYGGIDKADSELRRETPERKRCGAASWPGASDRDIEIHRGSLLKMAGGSRRPHGIE